MSVPSPLLAIVGVTASGKSDLAIHLAEKFNGEIICADSRTVYRGMDIVTAKPSAADQARVRHHLLDVVDLDQRLSAADFQRMSYCAINDIQSRGRLPIIVGGSGLYVDSVLYDYQFARQADEKLREELEGLSDDDLKQRLEIAGTEAHKGVDLANRRRVIRAIETVGSVAPGKRQLKPGTLVLGVDLNNEVIQLRIKQRIEKMLGEGLIDEVTTLAQRFGWDSEGMTGVGYRAFRGVIEGTKTIDEGVVDFAVGDMKLVKKQRTWFRRNPDIHWLGDPAEADELVQRFLSSDV